MYHILNQAATTLPTPRPEANFRASKFADFVVGLETHGVRFHIAPAMVNLTSSTTSGAASDPFKIRWTSLSA
jgi:hypothetical protein